MRHSWCVALFLFAVGMANISSANFLVQQVPKENTSVHYHLTLGSDGQANKLDTHLVVKSLDGAMVDGVPCRWLEFVVRDLDEKNPKIMSVHKLLVEEKQIGRGKSPLDGLKQVWVAGPSLRPKRIDLGFAKSEDGYLSAVYLPNPFKTTSPHQKEKKVPYQSGTLHIKAGTKAVQDFKDGGEQAQAKYTFWTHESIPTGFAQGELKFQSLNGKQVTSTRSFEFNLMKIEKTAKSLLPDVK